MDEKYAAPHRETGLKPGGQFGSIGMARIFVDPSDAGAHLDLFALDAHALGSVGQEPAERAGSLEACEEDGGVGLPQVVLEMVANAARLAHAAGGDDGVEAGKTVQGFRLLHR